MPYRSDRGTPLRIRQRRELRRFMYFNGSLVRPFVKFVTILRPFVKFVPILTSSSGTEDVTK